MTVHLGLSPTHTPLGESKGPVEQACGGGGANGVDGQQSHWNIGRTGSASLTHITGEVKHQKQEHHYYKSCAIPEYTLIINKYDLSEKYEFEANTSSSNTNIGVSSFGGIRHITTGAHLDSTIAGLGVRSRSYYYLYGSVTRCDACDGCDKDMACERVNASALLSVNVSHDSIRSY